jgi:hypothetical protein
MLKRLLATIAFTAFAATAHAQTPEQQAAVARAAAVGWELYEHDQAAWHGTDAMLADVPDPQGEGIHGYITERTPDGVQLLFVKGEGEHLSAAYRALWRDGALREHGRVDQPLTEAQARIWRARQLATTVSPPQQCAPHYNTVTLPRDTPGPDGADIDVYLMPAMTTNEEIPFGGHFRLAIDSAAGEVREIARFTNACVSLPRGDRAAGLFITQLIGDTPTEVHVFESLTAGLPIFVSTHSGVWSIEGRTIRHLDTPPAAEPAHKT